MFKSPISKLVTWARRRREKAELERYSDAQLRDLGIRRDQISDYLAGKIGPGGEQVICRDDGNIIYFTPFCCPVPQQCRVR